MFHWMTAARILADEVIAGRCVLKNWDEAVEQWILRVNWLHEWMPELGIPAVGDDDRKTLIEQICHGATSYKEIKDKPVWPVMKAWLSGQQQAWVEEYTPERIELPGGRKAKVTYTMDGPPTLAARIQDLYGVKEGFWIAQRRVPLRIEILAPNQTARAGDGEPRHLLAGDVSEVEAGTSAEVSETRVAMRIWRWSLVWHRLGNLLDFWRR